MDKRILCLGTTYYCVAHARTTREFPQECLAAVFFTGRTRVGKQRVGVRADGNGSHRPVQLGVRLAVAYSYRLHYPVGEHLPHPQEGEKEKEEEIQREGERCITN